MQEAEITKSYTGFSRQALTSDEIRRIFDAIYGADNQHLPNFPEILGSFQVTWQDSEGNTHKVTHLSHLVAAYEKMLTAKVTIVGNNRNQLQCMITYFPADKKARISATGNLERVNEAHAKFKEFFPMLKKPLIFISYDTAEIKAAFFVDNLLKGRWVNEIEVFIAKRDIPSGKHPFQTMLEKNLLQAEAVIPICSEKSMSSRWLWWEAASVWAKNRKVYPLYAGISPDSFGDPLKTLFQGRDFFDASEMNQWLKDFAKDSSLAIPKNLNEPEIAELRALKEKLFSIAASADAQEHNIKWIAEARKRSQEGLFK